MLRRFLFLFFLLFINSITVVSQSKSPVNIHVAFSDYLTENISKSRNCMRLLHEKLTIFKETNPDIYINYNTINCISQPKEYYYAEANVANYNNNDYVQDSWLRYNQ